DFLEREYNNIIVKKQEVHEEEKQKEEKQVKRGEYIKLPPYIAHKKAVINIKNNDNKCFKWCILAHLHPVKKNAERVWHYKPHENELKDDGITYPMQISDIDKFEKMKVVICTKKPHLF